MLVSVDVLLTEAPMSGDRTSLLLAPFCFCDLNLSFEIESRGFLCDIPLSLRLSAAAAGCVLRGSGSGHTSQNITITFDHQLSLPNSRVILLYTLLVLFEVDKQKAKNMPRDEENASDMWQ
jgi:hypothetical protein